MTVADLVQALSESDGKFPVNFSVHYYKGVTLIDWYTDKGSTSYELISKLKACGPHTNVCVEDNILEYRRLVELTTKGDTLYFIIASGYLDSDGYEREYTLEWRQ